MRTYRFLMLFTVTLLAFSCKKEKEPEHIHTSSTGSVTLELAHQWQSESAINDLALETDYIHAVTNDTFNFTTFKYYISNLKLKKDDGTWWSQPESYFLIDLADGSLANLTLSEVPIGNYTDLEVTFGVDSTRNVSGAQTGALSLTHGMFWSWNTGYIMTKAEGISPNSATNSFAFHLAGFTGNNRAVMTRSYHFNDLTLQITADHESELGLATKVNTMWNQLQLSDYNNIQTINPTSHQMSLDFQSGFSFDHLHN
jgi:hypothetical protein